MILMLMLQATAPCPATPAPLPPELAGWTPMTTVRAIVAAPRPVTVGHGIEATLLPIASVRLAVTSDHARPGSYAGLFTFAVAVPGRYRVALGAGGWIDVIAAGKPLTSVAHGHGPACSPIRKMVDFDLAPGEYRLQLTGSDSARLPLMIVRLS